MSFTTGALLHQESVIIAELFLKLRSWNQVREAVLAGNLLQAKTLNSSQRLCREICSRLKLLHLSELELLAEGSYQEQGYLLWLAICRRYRFIGDFAAEVVREKFISLYRDLSHEDFDRFFNRKTEWHEELERICPATRAKSRQVLFKMLREAGLLTAERMINPVILSPQVLQAIPKEDLQDTSFFPVFESDLRKWAH